jgi:hypothetical protein
MKKIYKSFLILVLTSFSAFAQTPAVDQLNSANTEANGIKSKVTDARKASNTLTKQLLLAGFPSAVSFESAVSNATNGMQDNVDNIQYHVNQALTLSSNGFSATRILQTANLLNAQIGTIDGIRSQIVAAIQAQNKPLAQQLLPQLNAALSRQTTLANQAITRINQAKDIIRPFQVCVRTVNSQGVPVAASDLFGFYCVKSGSYELIDPSNQEGTCWTLPAGTFEFGSYPGYFSGTSSKTLTLNRSLEVNGVITVDLVYWSE